MQLSAETTKTLRNLVDAACADPQRSLPGTTVTLVDRTGATLFSHSSGKAGLNSPEDLTPEHVFWIASCTKTVTGVLVMQAVERGLLRLDDADQIENLCPELKDLKVFEDDGPEGGRAAAAAGGGGGGSPYRLTEKKKKITLRMLLTHTAGFGYAFCSDKLFALSQLTGANQLSGRIEDLCMPLLFQPGEGWHYGVSIDWAGIALERASGQRLESCLQENIAKPLGLENITFFPTPEMQEKLAHMHQRRADGSIHPQDHLLQMPLLARSQEERDGCFHNGGAGLFAKPADYCRILSVLLNDGIDHQTNTRLLRKETVEMMFQNQIPQFPDFGRQGLSAAIPDLTNFVATLHPAPKNTPQGWGLTFMLPQTDDTGRSKGTGEWVGLPNQWWWCDRENGVAGFVCMHLLPFADSTSRGLWQQIETAFYKAVKGNLDDGNVSRRMSN